MTTTDPAELPDATPDITVTGSPAAIWLVYGELEHDDTHAECYRSGEVTWCDDQQFPSDVRYVRADSVSAALEYVISTMAKAVPTIYRYAPVAEYSAFRDALDTARRLLNK